MRDTVAEVFPAGRGTVPGYEKGLAAEKGRASAEKVRKGEWRKTAPKTKEALLAAAARNSPLLDKGGARIAKEVAGITYKSGGVKTLRSLNDKIDRGKKPDQITDAARGTLIADTPVHAQMGVDEVKKDWQIVDEDWHATGDGYIDRKVILRARRLHGRASGYSEGHVRMPRMPGGMPSSRKSRRR